MKRRALLSMLFPVALAGGCTPAGNQVDAATAGSAITIQGSAQKGPFIQGSAVTIGMLDGVGNSTGVNYNAVTSNDRGEFNLVVAAPGNAELIGEGFYFNEHAGVLSGAAISLRALYRVEETGVQRAHINIVTHMAAQRAKRLVQQGLAFATAVAQAERELRAALGVIHPAGANAGLGTSMDILGGESADNAYLFSVSCIVTYGQTDAQLQELINQIAADLDDDGALAATLRSRLAAAERALDPQRCMDNMRVRLTAIGSDQQLPDINQVIDSDQDGQANAVDADDDGDTEPDTTDCARLDATLQVQLATGACVANDDDDDGDGTPDAADCAPLDASKQVLLTDGVSCVADTTDDDSDGLPDGSDCAPRDPSEQVLLADGFTCVADDGDDDDDGALDASDCAPRDAAKQILLGDGATCSADDSDDDDDGFADADDCAPRDPRAHVVLTNLACALDDDDDDDDGVADGNDCAPLAASEQVWLTDGVSCVADTTDDDSDGLPDGSDCAPRDPNEQFLLVDGVTCVADDADDDNDAVLDGNDCLPLDPSKQVLLADAVTCVADDDDDDDDGAMDSADCAPRDPRRYPAAAERCDGLDNNCDDRVDADDPQVAVAPCENQTQVCAASVHHVSQCVGGQWQPCGAAEYGANAAYGAELCDGLDNDCDGVADEDFPTLASGCSLPGVCGDGVLECNGADPTKSTLICDVGPGGSRDRSAAEACGNTDDENCNGLSDEPVFTQLAAGGGHVCALSAGEAATCWGANGAGQAVAPAGTYRAVVAGDDHTCGLLANDTLRCWGALASAPSGTFKHLAAGGAHTCAVAQDDTVTCWGSDSDGQATPPSGTFLHLAAGAAHTCGIRSDGTLTCWGAYSFNRTVPPEGTYIALAAGGSHSCALAADYSVSCWGRNIYGETNPPTGTFVEIAVGGDGTYGHSCGRMATGKVVCWGSERFGVAGNGMAHQGIAQPDELFTQLTVGREHACGLTARQSMACWGTNRSGQAMVPEANITQVVVGARGGSEPQGCVLRSDGAARCWFNQMGPYGYPGTLAGRFTSLAMSDSTVCGLRADQTVACASPYLSSLAGSYTQVAVGATHACGLRTDGRIICGGDDSFGQSSAPPLSFTRVAAGARTFTCGLKANGSITCWGTGATPPAGTFVDLAAGPYAVCGIAADRSLACTGSTPPVAEYTQVAVGETHACGLLTDQSVVCWGASGGTETIPPGGTYLSVAAAAGMSCGVKTDGSLGCWGTTVVAWPAVQCGM